MVGNEDEEDDEYSEQEADELEDDSDLDFERNAHGTS